MFTLGYCSLEVCGHANDEVHTPTLEFLQGGPDISGAKINYNNNIRRRRTFVISFKIARSGALFVRILYRAYMERRKHVDASERKICM